MIETTFLINNVQTQLTLSNATKPYMANGLHLQSVNQTKATNKGKSGKIHCVAKNGAGTVLSTKDISVGIAP